MRINRCCNDVNTNNSRCSDMENALDVEEVGEVGCTALGKVNGSKLLSEGNGSVWMGPRMVAEADEEDGEDVLTVSLCGEYGICWRTERHGEDEGGREPGGGRGEGGGEKAETREAGAACVPFIGTGK